MALFLAGCGSNEHHISNTPTPTPTPTPATTAQLKFIFHLAQAKTEVPVTVNRYEFTGYDQEDKVVYPAFIVAKDKVITEGQEQSVILENVPLTCTKIVIKYLAADDKIVAQSIVGELALIQGIPNVIHIGEVAPIVEACLTVKFNLSSIPGEIANYLIKVRDSKGFVVAQSEKKSIENLQDYTFSEVPLNSNSIEVVYYQANGDIYGASLVVAPSLKIGTEVFVTVTDIIVGQKEINLSIKGIWENAPAGPASCQVDYLVDGTREEYATISGLDVSSGAVSFQWETFGKSVDIQSIVFRDAKNCAFEWFDNEQPVAVSANGKTTVIDIESNTFAGGDGSAASPYLVANPRQLSMVGSTVDNSSAVYSQIKEIDFAGSCGLSASLDSTSNDLIFSTNNSEARFYRNGQGWKPIGITSISNNGTEIVGQAFTGIYLGQTYSIDALYVNASHSLSNYTPLSKDGSYAGLFGLVNGAEIFNVAIYSGAVRNECNATAYAGGICGGIVANDKNDDSDCLLSYCHNRMPVVAKTTEYASYAGGLSGSSYNCIITGGNNLGSVVAINDNQSAPSGVDSVRTAAGGICGYLNDSGAGDPEQETKVIYSVFYAFNEGEISVIGKPSSSLTVDASLCAGGIAGVFQDARIGESKNYGKIIGNNALNNSNVTVNLGGIAGISQVVDDPTFGILQGHTTDYCYNFGDINSVTLNGQIRTGGICGESSGIEYSSCVNNASINNNAISNANGSCLGGIVAVMHDKGSAIQCCNLGELKNFSDNQPGACGGLIGLCDKFQLWYDII